MMQVKAEKANATANPIASLSAIAIHSVIGIEVSVTLAKAKPAFGKE